MFRDFPCFGSRNALESAMCLLLALGPTVVIVVALRASPSYGLGMGPLLADADPARLRPHAEGLFKQKVHVGKIAEGLREHSSFSDLQKLFFDVVVARSTIINRVTSWAFDIIPGLIVPVLRNEVSAGAISTASKFSDELATAMPEVYRDEAHMDSMVKDMSAVTVLFLIAKTEVDANLPVSPSVVRAALTDLNKLGPKVPLARALKHGCLGNHSMSACESVAQASAQDIAAKSLFDERCASLAAEMKKGDFAEMDKSDFDGNLQGWHASMHVAQSRTRRACRQDRPDHVGHLQGAGGATMEALRHHRQCVLGGVAGALRGDRCDEVEE